jgi:uncharacterized membrane protein
MAFCSSCGGQVPAGAAVCPACGHSAAAPAAPAAVATTQAPGSGLTDNVAGMLAYVTIIPAILFLVLEPYNKNRFIRFHSFQSIFFAVGWIALWIGVMIISAVLAFIPILGHLIALLMCMVISIGFFIIWIILLIKANQGQMYKLPIIGDLAEKQSNA